MASQNDSRHNFEVRKLEYLHKQKLGHFLDQNDCWKRLMDVIPITFRPIRSLEKRFNYDDICTIERAVRSSGCSHTSPTELLIDEWGTMGQFRPTVEDLLVLCQEIDAISAASYISEKILLNGPIEPLLTGPLTFTLDFTDPTVDYDAILEDELESAANEEFVDSDLLTGPQVPEHTLKTHSFRYAYLFAISDGFREENLLGLGGFSKVYLGTTRRKKMMIAIKVLFADEADPETMLRQLNYEIDQLPRLRHPNIIDLIGYSNDVKDKTCLLYPYMPNGTLEKKLRAQNQHQVLISDQRWNIALGVASGLNHLHSRPKPLIHRDVKTSNILINEHCVPKIADFGLLRFGVSGEGDTVTMTEVVRGTPVYMPPEAISGDVSTKWDVWSYGVVLLELLTGLLVLDRSREDQDLVTYIHNKADETNFTVADIVDVKARWSLDRAQIIYDLSLQCMHRNKRNRPTMAEVMAKLESCSFV